MKDETSEKNPALVHHAQSDPVEERVPVRTFLTPVYLWAAGATPLYHFDLLFPWTESEFEPGGCWSSSPRWRPCAGSAETHRRELMQPILLLSINKATQQQRASSAKKPKTKRYTHKAPLCLSRVTCPGLGLVAALLSRPSGSDWGTELSLLARSRGWECSAGRGRVWALSLLPGMYFGDSKKGTCNGGLR